MPYLQIKDGLHGLGAGYKYSGKLGAAGSSIKKHDKIIKACYYYNSEPFLLL